MIAIAVALAIGSTWTGAASAAPVSFRRSAALTGGVLASDAQTTGAPRKGVVVVGVGASPQAATWPVATAVYADASIRPRVDDRTARVLAGEPVDPSAPADLSDLASLRQQLRAESDAAARVLLAEVARRTRARALALVVRDGDTVEVRVYDAADDRLESTRHRAETTGEGAWSPLVGTLRARFAAAPTPKPSVAVAPTPAPAAPAPDAPKKGGSFLSSPWFWGAIGAVVAGGVAAWALTRDDGGSPPVRIEWGAR